MRRKIFLRKFAKMSDIELRYILDNKDKYVEDAVYAAKFILQYRESQFIPNSNASQQKEALQALEDQIDQMEIPKPKVKEVITNDLNDPELYTKRTITVFTVLFGMLSGFGALIGATLMMYNFSKTKNPKPRIYVFVFGLFFSLFYMMIIRFLPERLMISAIINLGAAQVMTGVFWNNYIGREFEHREKDWITAAFITLLVILPIMLLMLASS